MIQVLFFLLTTLALACGEKKLMLKAGDLRACAEAPTGTVHDLSIEARGKILFDGDAAFKAYQVARVKDGIEIREAANSKTFEPYVLLVATCSKDRCVVRDHSCVWKKSKTLDGKTVDVIREAIRRNKSVTDDQWDAAFRAALNGSKEARDLFRGPMGDGANASGSESFLTLKEDVERLQRLGCL